MSAILPLEDPSAAPSSLDWVERGLLPDVLVRAGIRRQCGQRLAQIGAGDAAAAAERTTEFIDAMRAAPIALLPELANAQHYEVPAEFFALVLGPHRKYSCAFWDDSTRDLGMAEERALALTAERAGLANGQRILELGCGWGSLTLWMARQFPDSRIVAVSNSHSQRDSILTRAQLQGLDNVEVITGG